MKLKTQRAVALTLLFATTAICVASIPGLVDTWDVRNEGAWGFRGFGLAAAMIFALAGALLAFKRPENPVGWLFGAVGAAFALLTAGETYAVIPLIDGNDAGIRYQVAWLTSWGWVIFLGLIAFSILLFPSGHLPSPSWSPWARAMVVGFALGGDGPGDPVQPGGGASSLLATFSSRLRDRVDLDSLGHDLVGVVGATMQPTHVSLWLRTVEEGAEP